MLWPSGGGWWTRELYRCRQRGSAPCWSGPSSSLYYRPREASGENLALMQWMDRHLPGYTLNYGSRRMKVWLGAGGQQAGEPEAAAAAEPHHGVSHLRGVIAPAGRRRSAYPTCWKRPPEPGRPQRHGTFPIVVPPPPLDFLPSILQRQEPAFVQTLFTKPGVEGLDHSVVSRLAWPAEVQLHAVQVRPLVKTP